jgi:DNA-binding response OmpR family regulator
VDTTRRTLELSGEPVELTRREFDLLAFLERHRGQALGRDELMRAVWHTGYISGDRTIDVHVRRLRVKLGPHADRLVTLRGYGYRLD